MWCEKVEILSVEQLCIIQMQVMVSKNITVLEGNVNTLCILQEMSLLPLIGLSA